MCKKQKKMKIKNRNLAIILTLLMLFGFMPYYLIYSGAAESLEVSGPEPKDDSAKPYIFTLTGNITATPAKINIDIASLLNSSEKIIWMIEKNPALESEFYNDDPNVDGKIKARAYELPRDKELLTDYELLITESENINLEIYNLTGWIEFFDKIVGDSMYTINSGGKYELHLHFSSDILLSHHHFTIEINTQEVTFGEPTTEPTTATTTESTTATTTESTTVPTTEPTTAPTTESTTAPTTESTTVPTTESTTVPTTESTTVPTTESPPTKPPEVCKYCGKDACECQSLGNVIADAGFENISKDGGNFSISDIVTLGEIQENLFGAKVYRNIDGEWVEVKGEMTPLGTGMEIRNGNKADGVIVIVIKNDLTGNGTPGIDDAKVFLEYLVGNKALTGAYKSAADHYNYDEPALKNIRNFLNNVIK